MNSAAVISNDGYVERRFTSQDGLRLFARDYGVRSSRALTAVCLPGFARHSADFHELALRFSQDATPSRRVVCFDYRGRGQSARDPDWRNYDPRIEVQDLMAGLDALGIAEACFIGVSRGGLLTMALGAARPNAILGSVLVDVGPVIDGKGLARIKGYVGKMPQPRDWADAADILRRLSDAQFPHFTPEHWDAIARRTWTEVEGRIVPAYDPALARKLEEIDLDAPLPDLWPYFDTLKHVPMLAVRGGNSDLLSAATLAAMAARHPSCQTLTVPDQGHTPLVGEPPLADTIAAFIGGLGHD